MSTDLHARRELLRARCREQRATLARHTRDIDQRLESVDHVLGVAQNLLGKTAAIAGGTALWWSARRTGWLGVLMRGVTLLTTARRIHALFKTR